MIRVHVLRRLFGPAFADSGKGTRGNRHYFYLQDNNGDENFHLWMFDIETKTGRDLTPFGSVKAQNLLISPNRPDEILVGLNRRDNRVFDMHRIDLKTYEVKLENENPGNVRYWAADRDLVVRAEPFAPIPGSTAQVR